MTTHVRLNNEKTATNVTKDITPIALDMIYKKLEALEKEIGRLKKVINDRENEDDYSFGDCPEYDNGYFWED